MRGKLLLVGLVLGALVSGVMMSILLAPTEVTMTLRPYYVDYDWSYERIWLLWEHRKGEGDYTPKNCPANNWIGVNERTSTGWHRFWFRVPESYSTAISDLKFCIQFYADSESGVTDLKAYVTDLDIAVAEYGLVYMEPWKAMPSDQALTYGFTPGSFYKQCFSFGGYSTTWSMKGLTDWTREQSLEKNPDALYIAIFGKVDRNDVCVYDAWIEYKAKLIKLTGKFFKDVAGAQPIVGNKLTVVKGADISIYSEIDAESPGKVILWFSISPPGYTEVTVSSVLEDLSVGKHIVPPPVIGTIEEGTVTATIYLTTLNYTVLRDEQGKEYSYNITVEIVGPTEIKVESITCPSSVSSGQSFTISATLKNYGIDGSAKYYLDGVEKGSVSLAYQETKSVSIGVTAPTVTATTTKTYKVTTEQDATGKTCTVTITPPPKCHLHLSSSVETTSYTVAGPETKSGAVGTEYVLIDIDPGTYSISCTKSGYTCTNCPMSFTCTASQDVYMTCQMAPAPPPPAKCHLNLNSSVETTSYTVTGPETKSGSVGTEYVSIDIDPGTYSISCTKSNYTCTNCPISFSCSASQDVYRTCQMAPVVVAPEIVVESLSCTPATGAPGYAFSVSALLHNRGAGDGSAKYYWNGVYKGATPTLSKNCGSYTVSFTEIAPAAPGSYTYTLTTDHDPVGKSCTITVTVAPPKYCTIRIRTEPVAGDIYVDMAYKARGSYEFTGEVCTSYSVSFGPVEGYTTPPAQTAHCRYEGEVVDVVGKYSPVIAVCGRLPICEFPGDMVEAFRAVLTENWERASVCWGECGVEITATLATIGMVIGAAIIATRPRRRPR